MYIRKNKPFPIAEAIKLYVEFNRSIRMIAKALGYTYGNVQYQLNKAGVRLKDKGGANNPTGKRRREEFEHGTSSRYLSVRYKCRCEECTEAIMAFWKDARRRREDGKRLVKRYA